MESATIRTRALRSVSRLALGLALAVALLVVTAAAWALMRARGT